MQEILTEYDAEELLKEFNIPVSKRYLVQDVEEALDYAKSMSFPVDLKIISRQVLHKSDIKGVRICQNAEEIKEEYLNLMIIVKKRKIKLQGILVQEYQIGKELLIGIKKDPTFGHVIGFGIGGIYTEFFKDVEFRVCPITEKDASGMISDLKGSILLLGVRGEKKSKISVLKKILVKVSKIPERYSDIFELDINPFIINDKTGKVVDALIIYD